MAVHVICRINKLPGLEWRGRQGYFPSHRTFRSRSNFKSASFKTSNNYHFRCTSFPLFMSCRVFLLLLLLLLHHLTKRTSSNSQAIKSQTRLFVQFKYGFSYLALILEKFYPFATLSKQKKDFHLITEF